MKPSVTESSLDAVLQRLLLADRNAATLFLGTTARQVAGVAADRVTVARQVRHANASGTADLVVRYWSGASCVAVLLVENKIDAGFTPDQPARSLLCIIRTWIHGSGAAGRRSGGSLRAM